MLIKSKGKCPLAILAVEPSSFPFSVPPVAGSIYISLCKKSSCKYFYRINTPSSAKASFFSYGLGKWGEVKAKHAEPGEKGNESAQTEGASADRGVIHKYII